MKSRSHEWNEVIRELESDPEACLLCPACGKADLLVTDYRDGEVLCSRDVLCPICGHLETEKYKPERADEEPSEWSRTVDDFYAFLKERRMDEAVTSGQKLLKLSQQQTGQPDFAYVLEVAAAAQPNNLALAEQIRGQSRSEADQWLIKILSVRNVPLEHFADQLRSVAKVFLSDPNWKERDAEALNRKAEAYFRKAAAMASGSEDRFQDAMSGVITALRYRGKEDQANALEKCDRKC